MPNPSRPEQVSVDVITAFARAVESLSDGDIDSMAKALGIVVGVYEQHPSLVHEPVTDFRDVLLWIRAGRNLCATLRRSDADFAALEDRAEALRRPLH
jgi:hypothetical protein